MKKKISKTEATELIDKFFKDIKNKSSNEVKKIKRLAMLYNLPLKEKRKLFCRKCFTPYTNKGKVRIKNKVKSIECQNCGNLSRWKINSS